MINGAMRYYDFYTITTGFDEYGQPKKSETKQGKIKMSINITSQSIQDNINYKDSKYIGLTTNYVDDTYIIEYGQDKLKVLYVNPIGRFKQVFLGDINA